MRRREFLRTSLGSLAGAAALGVPDVSLGFGDGPSRGKSKVLVAIYLRGGADALNMVVPYADDLYYGYRPGIAIPREDGENGKGVVVLDERFGLHPALAPLKPLYDAKTFAPIVCVGSPHPTRSHFDAQDFMEYAAPGLRAIEAGWLNRYLQRSRGGQDDELRALAMQRLLPRALRGDYPALAVPQRPRRSVEDVLDTFEDLYGAPPAEKAGQMAPRREDAARKVGKDTIATLRRLYDVMDQGWGDGDVEYPADTFSRGMESIAQVIRADAGLEVACLDVTGWDHHINEGGSTGDMATRLGSVAGGLAAFTKDLGSKRMKDVTVMVMTEFGRTVRENGNRGTDHGHGGCMFLIGGAVAGGKVHGEWKGLDEKRLYQGRDLVASTDFRLVFHDVLEEFMGFETPKGFFPGYTRSRAKVRLFA